MSNTECTPFPFLSARALHRGRTERGEQAFLAVRQDEHILAHPRHQEEELLGGWQLSARGGVEGEQHALQGLAGGAGGGDGVGMSEGEGSFEGQRDVAGAIERDANLAPFQASDGPQRPLGYLRRRQGLSQLHPVAHGEGARRAGRTLEGAEVNSWPPPLPPRHQLLPDEVIQRLPLVLAGRDDQSLRGSSNLVHDRPPPIHDTLELEDVAPGLENREGLLGPPLCGAG
jgi:hypothetical protein